MRLIDADALINRIVFHTDWPVDEKEAFEDEINAEPTIEPGQKKGRWVPVDSYTACGGDESTWMAHGNPTAFYYCSECKKHAYAGEDGADLLTDFCPACGADLREGEG